MARSYNTIPTHEADAPKQTKSLKGIVAGAALASFVLGVLAMTAVRAPAATPLANLSKGGLTYVCDADPAGGYTDLKACLDEAHNTRRSPKARLIVQLGKGHFSLSEQLKIPQMTTIQGTIENKHFATFVTATKPNPYDNNYCGECDPDTNDPLNGPGDPRDGRIGFLLGDHTVVKDLTFVSLDTDRYCQCIFGGFVFETPGCATTNCRYSDPSADDYDERYTIKSHEGKDFITDAKVDNIFITGQDSNGEICNYGNWADDDCDSAPQGALYIPMNPGWERGESTSKVTMSRVTMLKSWADSTNIHGAARDVTIRDNTLWFAGDDSLGIWSTWDAAHGLTNVKLIGNDLSQIRSNNIDPQTNTNTWGSCVAVYGFGDELIIENNICRGFWDTTNDDPPVYHGAMIFSKAFAGEFADPAHVWIRGTRFADHDEDRKGYPDPNSVPLLDHTTISEASARSDNNVDNWVPFDKQNVGGLVLNNCPMVKTDSARWQDADHYGAPDPSYITQDCTKVKWDDDGAMGQGWYCQGLSDKKIILNTEGYRFKASDNDVPYAASCIHFNCQAGTGYNKDMKMWQCLDDF